jgi:hypothetical protein
MSKHTPQRLGSYLIYPSGRIVSTTGWRGHKERELTAFHDDDNYLFVRLVLNGKRKKWRVHRLMAELFLPPRPSLDHEICHVDGNQLNNSVNNLRWGTRKQNADDREMHGRTSRGAPHKEAIKAGIERARASARLIAAAPEMLEALKAVSDAFWQPMTTNRIEVAAKVDRAIAKAEGKK